MNSPPKKKREGETNDNEMSFVTMPQDRFSAALPLHLPGLTATLDSVALVWITITTGSLQCNLPCLLIHVNALNTTMVPSCWGKWPWYAPTLVKETQITQKGPHGPLPSSVSEDDWVKGAAYPRGNTVVGLLLKLFLQLHAWPIFLGHSPHP